MSTPDIEILVLPGSLFCSKVMMALHHKNLPYRLTSIHPTKLKKQLPAPHTVPVIRYNKTETITDSAKILSFIDTKHPVSHGTGNGLYPITIPVNDEFKSVTELEKFAHDNLSHLYYYFGAVSMHGRNNITKPFLKQILPKPLTTILPFVPTLGSKAAAGQLLKRVHSVMDPNLVKNEETAKKTLYAALDRLEKSFKDDNQSFVLGTDQPTAGDFGVFVALKRLAHPIPELYDGIPEGLPGLFKEKTDVPRTFAFFERMDKLFYQGKVDWSGAEI